MYNEGKRRGALGHGYVKRPLTDEDVREVVKLSEELTFKLCLGFVGSEDETEIKWITMIVELNDKIQKFKGGKYNPSIARECYLNLLKITFIIKHQLGIPLH